MATVAPPAAVPADGPSQRYAAVTLADAEREPILGTLRDTCGVVGRPKGAAARLGMKRPTLQTKMQKLDISRLNSCQLGSKGATRVAPGWGQFPPVSWVVSARQTLKSRQPPALRREAPGLTWPERYLLKREEGKGRSKGGDHRPR